MEGYYAAKIREVYKEIIINNFYPENKNGEK
jgi:hypothetical protein